MFTFFSILHKSRTNLRLQLVVVASRLLGNPPPQFLIFQFIYGRKLGIYKRQRALLCFGLVRRLQQLSQCARCHGGSRDTISLSHYYYFFEGMGLYLLDYGAGNVQSLANSLKRLGYTFQWIQSPKDFEHASVRIDYDGVHCI